MALRPTQRQYQHYVLAAGISLVLIVLTGAAVRLTDAGLGCENWPTCTDQRLTPEWELHGWIEFGNRLLSGVVAVAVCLAVLTAYRRTPRRADLIGWSWGLVVGVAAQIIAGGITVLVDLHPIMVAVHYLLSMALLWNVTVLWFKASSDDRQPALRVSQSLHAHTLILLALAASVALAGTVTTGTGPNGGDPQAERLPFTFSTVAQLHGISVWVFIAASVGLAFRLRSFHHSPTNGRRFDPSQLSPRTAIAALLAASVGQGAVGYTQYFRGVPPVLVEIHIFGAVAVWILTVTTYLSLYERTQEAN